MADHLSRFGVRHLGAPEGCRDCAALGGDDTGESGSLATYERQLEDALLACWAELPLAQVRMLRQEAPAMVDFIVHLHHRADHHEAMVRRNVWTP